MRPSIVRPVRPASGPRSTRAAFPLLTAAAVLAVAACAGAPASDEASADPATSAPDPAVGETEPDPATDDPAGDDDGANGDNDAAEDGVPKDDTGAGDADASADGSETQAPREAIARHVADVLVSGEAVQIEELISGPVAIEAAHSIAEDPHDLATTLADAAAFAAWVEAHAPHFACPDGPLPEDECRWLSGLYVRTQVRCSGTDGCCGFYDEGGERMLLHNEIFLDDVCFDLEADGGLRLRSISFTDGD